MTIWQLRIRQLQADVDYWLAAVGVDLADHSLMGRLFLVYATLFFMAWGFAVFSLFAGTLAPLAASMELGIIRVLSATAGATLVVWSVGSIRVVLCRSPFDFSEQDAFMVCASPAKPEVVALAWLLGPWPTQALPFWALALLLGFIRAEVGFGLHVSLGHIVGAYLASGIQCLAIIAPLQLGLMATIWAFGVLRLGGSKERRRLRLITLVLVLALVLLTMAPKDAVLSLVTWLSIPLRGAFECRLFPVGLIASAGVAGLGLVALRLSASSLSLLRAAQDSSMIRNGRKVAALKPVGVTIRFQNASRLLSSSPEKGPRAAETAVLWKDIIQTARGPRTSAAWLLYAILSVATHLVPDWSTRSWLVIFWLLQLGSLAVGSIRRDLGNWWVLRQLPLEPRLLVVLDAARAWVGMIAACILVTAGLLILDQPLDSIVTAVLGGSLMSAPFAASLDVLTRSRSEDLLLGKIPDIGWRYLAIATSCAMSSFLLARLVMALTGSHPAVLASCVIVQALIGYVLLHSSGRRFRQVR